MAVFCSMVLAVSCVLCAVISGEERVRVFSLQRGIWKPSNTETYVQYFFEDEGKILTDFTICYRFRIESFVFLNAHFSYAVSEDNTNTFMLYHQGTRLHSFIRGKLSQIGTNTIFETFPEYWVHLCHVVNGSLYTVYHQGKIFDQGQLNVEATYVPLNGTIILGQEQDSYGGTFSQEQVFRGDIAQASVWNYALESEEIKKMADCRLIGQGNVFSLDTNEVILHGDVKEQMLDLEELCSYDPRYIVLPEPRKFYESQSLCSIMNTTITTPTTISENRHMADLILPYEESCGADKWPAWLGISDEATEDVWIDVNTKKPITFDDFVPPFPFGGVSLNCATIAKDQTWADAKCDDFNCPVCTLAQSHSLYLRGLCPKREHMNLVTVNDYIGGRPVFRGFYNNLIMWDDATKRWILKDSWGNTSLAWMVSNDINRYPLGKTEWITTTELCGYPVGANITLSLSMCSSDYFMCSSGSCIAHHQRCNLRHECDDGSDEDDCSIVVPNSSYRRHLPPTDRAGSKITVVPTFMLQRFANIDDMTMVVTIEFWLQLRWRDGRLRFRHLNSILGGSILSDEDLRKIWMPMPKLVNLEGGQAQVLETTVEVTTSHNATKPDYNAVRMDLIYPGSANDLFSARHYNAKFTCDFEFYAYPFDVQRCYMKLRLPKDQENHVHLAPEEGRVVHLGTSTLTLYTVRNIRFAEGSGEREVSVYFELHRRKGVVIMSTFMPSILLLMVSWATLFVKLEALNVRAIMSLTTLLVLYTLFANLSRSLPSTASIKLIDIWFFSIIFVLFVNIVIHIFVRPEVTNGTKQITVAPSAFEKRTTEDRMHISLKLMTIYRKFLLPAIIIVFNIVFWIIVLQ